MDYSWEIRLLILRELDAEVIEAVGVCGGVWNGCVGAAASEGGV